MKDHDALKPTILLVIADSSRTGGPKQVLVLMKGLLEQYRLALACPTGWLSEEAKKLNIEVHDLPSTRLKSRDSLKKIFEVVKPDLIHVHGVRGGMMTLFATPTPKDGIKSTPILYTEHTWTEDFPMMSHVRKALHLFLLRKFFKKTTKVIAVSKAVESFLVRHRIAPQSNIEVIYGGIEMNEEIEPVREAIVGFLGHISTVKGVHLLIKALALLHRHYPDLRCKIAGLGEELFYFQYLAHKLKVDQIVEWVGEVHEPHDFFKEIRVLVQPSLSEAFGLSVLEAMSCGIPVIASRVGGLPEIVEDNETGLTFPKGEVAVLASQLELLINDQPLYEKLSKNGRERASHFTTDRMIRSHLELYQQCLQKAPMDGKK